MGELTSKTLLVNTFCEMDPVVCLLQCTILLYVGSALVDPVVYLLEGSMVPGFWSILYEQNIK